MRKLKDAEWAIQNPPYSIEEASMSVLMDIRDELKTLNAAILNLKVESIGQGRETHRILWRISANTAKPRKRKEQL